MKGLLYISLIGNIFALMAKPSWLCGWLVGFLILILPITNDLSNCFIFQVAPLHNITIISESDYLL